MQLQYDFRLDIATGRSRKETAWKNKQVDWSAILDKIAVTHRTAELYKDYLAAKKERQDEIKDIGGFVGGFLTSGRRKSANVMERQLITLDIDHGPADIWEDYKLQYDNAAALYSTHKHSAETPRYRLLIVLDRAVFADQYEAIARRIAGTLGINYFDDTTFEAARLMYWPSTAKDGEYVFHHQDGPALSADEILASYRDWTDISQWPVSDRQADRIRTSAKKQGDPLEKPGIVGAFCRTYDIHEAIEKYLSDVYETTDQEGRYTYTAGSCAGGLITYDDKFAFSHHATDPAGGKLCNAFDLVRLHLHGLKDDDSKEDTPMNRRPSFLAMEETARKDDAVRLQLGRERLESAADEFAEDYQGDEDEKSAVADPASDEWLGKLEQDKKGNVLATVDNIVLILEHSPKLKGALAFDEFIQRPVVTRSLPWRSIKSGRFLTDRDEQNLSHHLEKFYGIPANDSKQGKALGVILERYKVHPVREYLNGLSWDGTPRVDGVLIDYLGAADTPYTRAVTRKTLTAAVARVFSPGCKFDYMLVLVGRQGVGKSTIAQKLGRTWFSDTFSTIEGKEGFEQLQGVWIVEMGELAGMKKAEVGAIKHFISKTVDRYRVAYGKHVTDFPRQCIIIGTTNNGEFLRNDANGNRKFWPVPVYEQAPTKEVWEELTEYEVGQIWAEALTLYRAGESLHLAANLEADAHGVQAEHTERDERSGAVAEFLDMPLPEKWYEWDIDERRSHLSAGDLAEAGTLERSVVCIAEIWCELFGRRLADMTSYNTKDLHAIMRNIPGWEATKGQRRIKNYGRQLTYKRIGIA